MTRTTQQPLNRLAALQEWLIANDYPEAKDVDEITDESVLGEFQAFGNEYLVLTDDEADLRAGDYIRDSLWAFNASFLSGHTGLPEEVFTALQDKCEGANDTFRELIEGCGDLAHFIDEAISADGRGHFMSSYDGEEHEQAEFFIYRIN